MERDSYQKRFMMQFVMQFMMQFMMHIFGRIFTAARVLAFKALSKTNHGAALVASAFRISGHVGRIL